MCLTMGHNGATMPCEAMRHTVWELGSGWTHRPTEGHSGDDMGHGGVFHWWCKSKKPPRRTWMVKCSRALRLCALTRRLLMDYGFPSYPQYPYCTFHTWLFGWTTPHVTTYSTDFDSSEVCKTTDCTTFSWITGHLAGFPWGSFCQGSEPLRCFQLSQGKTCAFYLNNNHIVFL